MGSRRDIRLFVIRLVNDRLIQTGFVSSTKEWLVFYSIAELEGKNVHLISCYARESYDCHDGQMIDKIFDSKSSREFNIAIVGYLS